MQPTEEWLYRDGKVVHGPVGKAVIAAKLARGELPLTIYVAREGGNFAPIGEVRAFAEEMRRARTAVANRSVSRLRGAVMVVLAILVSGVAAGTVLIYREVHAKKMAVEQTLRERQEKREARDKAVESAFAALPELAVVSLVAAIPKPAPAVAAPVTTDAVAPANDENTKAQQLARDGGRLRKGRGADARGNREAVNGDRTGGGAAAARRQAASEGTVSQCARSQQDILGVLGQHIGALNACVHAERQNDKDDLLPPTLVLEFIVRPDGRASNVGIDDDDYRASPLRNCWVKVFQSVTFPEVGGSNCPVRLPIRIKD